MMDIICWITESFGVAIAVLAVLLGTYGILSFIYRVIEDIYIIGFDRKRVYGLLRKSLSPAEKDELFWKYFRKHVKSILKSVTFATLFLTAGLTALITLWNSLH